MSLAALLSVVVGLLGADPARLERWSASPGTRLELARALSEADAPTLATGALVEALLLENGRPEDFGAALEAFPLSLDARPPVPASLVKLAAVPDLGLTDNQRALKAWLAGAAFLQAGDPVAATVQLQLVPPGTVVFPAARVLLGVAAVSGRSRDFTRAARDFQQAIEEADVSPHHRHDVVRQARRVALLGLGRVFYEVGTATGELQQLAVAQYYYRRLPLEAQEQVAGAFETAWVFLMAGEPQRALGAVHAARAPAVLHPAGPELRLVEAAAYQSLCRYAESRVALDELRHQYLAHLAPVTRLAAALDAEPGLDAAEVRARVRTLPVDVAALVLRHPAVRREARALEALRAEARRVGEAAPVAALAGRLEAVADVRLASGLRAAVRAVATDLARLDVAASELQIDVLEAQGERLEDAILAGASDETPPELRLPSMGQEWQRWAFDGTWYGDEITSFRSTLSAVCPADDAPKAGDTP